MVTGGFFGDGEEGEEAYGVGCFGRTWVRRWWLWRFSIWGVLAVAFSCVMMVELMRCNGAVVKGCWFFGFMVGFFLV